MTHLFALLPVDYQEVGNDIILEAARQCGASEDNLKIEWKGGRVVITVHGDVYVSDVESSGEDEEEIYGDDDIELEYTDEDESDDVDDDGEEADFDNDEDNDGTFQGDDIAADGNAAINDSTFSEVSIELESEGVQPRGVDISALARAINIAFDDGGVGLAIAEAHEIEVTTPGASDELQGPVMFRAYKGFDVLVTFMDPKKKTNKTIEGKLHERNNEFTVINIKGRMKKIKNDMLVSVKLPKAMKEKGTR